MLKGATVLQGDDSFWFGVPNFLTLEEGTEADLNINPGYVSGTEPIRFEGVVLKEPTSRSILASKD